MNKTLAIHFEQDFLIAGIEPLHGKFHNLTKRGNARYYFYFNTDTINNKIDYSILYKEKAQDGIENYFGNFYSNLESKTFRLHSYENEFVELLFPIVLDLREMYYTITKSLLSDNEIDETENIPLELSFSEYVNTANQAILTDFFKRNRFDVIEMHQQFPLIFSKEYLYKNGIEPKNKKIVFIDALGSDLHMSVVNVYNKFESEINIKQTFTNFGLDPRNFILAKKIVDEINKQEGLLSRESDLQNEYLRQLNLAQKLLENLDNQTSPYLQVETSFAIERNRPRNINISIDELNQLTFSHVRQIARYFETHFLANNNLSVNDFDFIILLGDILCNNSVKNEFLRFGKEKVKFLNSDDNNLVLRNLVRKVEVELGNTNFQRKEENWKELEFLNIKNLIVGQTVKLRNFDPAPGKGEAIQVFNYLGNNQFIVEMSTRSLQKGDTAEALAEVWVPGMQVELKISTNGKLKGKFTTRRIVQILVST